MSDQNIGTGVFDCTYKFTREELRELGLRLAAKAQEIYNQRAAKKAAVATMAAAITQLEADAEVLVRKLNNLYETRPVECSIHYHVPKHGYKTVIRSDTGDNAFDPLPMTESEMQSSFVFVDAPAKAKDKPQ